MTEEPRESGSEPQEHTGRQDWRQWLQRWRLRLWRTLRTLQVRWRLTLGVVGAFLAGLLILALWWSQEPALNDVAAATEARAGDEVPVTGLHTAVAVEETVRSLLHKPGGYLRNSRLPPAVLLDNMPNWELGVVWHMREWSVTLRRDVSRADAQATEDPDLVIVEPQFHFDTDSWMLPSTVSEYRRGLQHLGQYIERLQAGEAEFHPRAADLSRWLDKVERRVEDLNDALMASAATRVYQPESFLGLTAPEAATPRLQVDDILYQTRGYAWALNHSLQGVRVDYAPVFADADAATQALDQALLELSALQRPIWSPWVVNASGQGVLTNHSLVAAAHLARVRLALAELQKALTD